MTTLHDFEGVFGLPLDTFFFGSLSQFHGHGSWLVFEVALTFVNFTTWCGRTQQSPHIVCICPVLMFLVKLTLKLISKNLKPIQLNAVEMNQSRTFRSLSFLAWIKKEYTHIAIPSRPYPRRPHRG